MTNKYDPRDIRAHCGKTYETENSIYSFGVLGTFHGRKSIQGVVPELVAGLDKRYSPELEQCFNETNRQGLYDLVMRYGEEPKKGKHLVLVLDATDAAQTERIGFKSSLIRRIE
jgi:hypothetical protein